MIGDLVQISCSDWNHPADLQTKLGKASKIGFFYHEIPLECRQLIQETLALANSFHTQSEYLDLKLEGHSGYHDRKDAQVESVYLERKYWSILPKGIDALANKMHQLGIQILQQTLQNCQIPRADWYHASGGAAEGGGQVHFTMNHYRKDKPMIGIPEHCDFGQITVLFIDRKGLKAKINGVWSDVLPRDNHFIINYGMALQTSINDRTKLVAADHFVSQVTEDRISFGIFIDNADDSTIFLSEKGIMKNTNELYKDYLINSFKKTYEPS